MTYMNVKMLKNVEFEINKCKKQLKELEPYIIGNAAAAENYNRTLVKKAILIDKYRKLVKKENPASRIFGLLKFKKRPKLICDYFPNV